MNDNKVLSRIAMVFTIIFIVNIYSTTNLSLSLSNDNRKVYGSQIDFVFGDTIIANAATNNKKSKLNNEKVNKNNSSKKIKKKKKHKKKKRVTYSERDFYILSHVINGEAGGSSFTDKLYVGSVVLNRVKDKRFPNNLKGVVFAKHQYACTWDGNYNKTPNASSKKAAKILLTKGSQLPVKVVWQAQFKQGKGTYTKVGRHYYCY